jgi:hypothetical protein
MNVIYNPQNQSIIEPIVLGKSNANDIIGLDPSFLILEKVFVSTPTYDPQVENAIESWTIDLDNLQYVQTWTIVELIPTPDWTGFNLAIAADPYWQSWDIPTDLRNALICTAVVELENKFRTAYQTATAIVPPSPEAVASWKQVAAQFHIPLIF